MNRPRTTSAFTLIELVLVLALIAMLLAAIAPRFNGFGRGQRLDNAVESFLAASRFAHAQAIATAMPHRVEIDLAENTYWVSRLEGEAFIAVDGQWGQPSALPDGVDIDIERAGDAGLKVLDYAANGSGTPATITFSANWGQSVQVASIGLADPLRRVSNTGNK